MDLKHPQENKNILTCRVTVNLKRIEERKCLQCDYSTYQKDVLEEHLVVAHTKCPYCEYSPAIGVNHQRHIKSVHKKIKDQRSKLCTFASSYPKSLKEHIKSVHEKIKDLRCKQCDFKTSRHINLFVF
jgi:hypothetical protein